MALAGTLMIDMRADTARLRNDYDKSKRMTKGYEASARSSFNNIKQSVFTLKNAVGGLAAAMGVRQFVGFTKDSLEFADAIAKTSDKLGIGTAALQEFRFVAGRTGVDTGVLEKGLQNMVRGIADFSEGTGEAKDAFQKLNIEAEDLIRLSPDKQFELIAEQLKDVENNTEKVSIAYDIFGGRATALINTLNLGTKGISELRQEARAAGTVIDEDLIRKSEILNDKWDTLSETVSTSFREAAIIGTGMLVDIGEEVQTTAEWFAAYTLDQITFSEWISTGSEDAKARLAELKKGVVDVNNELEKGEKKGGVKESETKQGLNNAEIQAIITRDQAIYDLTQENGAALTSLEIEQIILRDQMVFNLEQENQQKLIASEEELRLDAQERKRENLKAYYREEEKFARQKANNIAKIEQRERDDQIRRGEQGFATMLGNAAAYNKTFFNIQKVYRLSKLAMEAPAAIADSFAWGASWGGPPAGAAMAGIAGAAMASYAVQLAGASYGGSGSASAGGGSSAVTAPTTLGQTSPFENPNITASNQNNNQTIINLYNAEGFSNESVSNLAEQLGDYLEKTDTVLIRNGSRGALELQQQ